jgi:ubiquinol-cytochrome c reductase iron-sulfur subunit
VANAVVDGDLVVAAVLSGNRNFEGRINPHVKANYLASPPLVVAYAIAGTMDINIMDEPLAKNEKGEKVYLRRHTGNFHDVSLVRPEDVEPGGFETVFPFRESERGDPDRLRTVLRSADDAVVLVRLPPGVAVVERAGQEDFHVGDLYAYSKICTHMGCPVSLYEQTTQRILCPCHQTEFQANEHARPVFGPGARPLPQLPLAVDERGHLYARHDFVEPVGPGFWERDPRG